MELHVKEPIVEAVVKEIYEAYPSLWERFGENGHQRTIEDNHHHLDHLETAFQMDDSRFFIDYTEWLNEILTSRNVGTELIVDNFQRLQKHIPGKLDSIREQSYLHCLELALNSLQNPK
ncbi:hypothetical protein NCCP2222_31450 [Sporosarcina sp. NCCP-2222]|uniref:hypothetical protein n=1 Tax=Sporosarcina sp. NCCP-2222 TaxID=2935073 RepID=UPI0020896090|nr:hypothetical protein [Sporosarcina sp. NCCP-2222]GKV57198.1 hypothetical protein NCCP2222_31450 [Sporosarcina sp. NCCP-2222]